MKSISTYLLCVRRIILLPRVLHHNTVCSMSTRAEKKAERKEKRQEIYKTLSKGAFSDFHDFRNTGGKNYVAQKGLIEKTSAPRFPSIEVECLSGERTNIHNKLNNDATLVLLWMRAIGQPMCDIYRQHFQREFQSVENVGTLELSIVEGPFYRMFRSFMIRSIKATVPQERQSSFLCYFGSTNNFQSKIIENTLVGHCFLVDSDGLIRWKAHAKPKEEELEYMIDNTRTLIGNRIKIDKS